MICRARDAYPIRVAPGRRWETKTDSSQGGEHPGTDSSSRDDFPEEDSTGRVNPGDSVSSRGRPRGDRRVSRAMVALAWWPMTPRKCKNNTMVRFIDNKARLLDSFAAVQNSLEEWRMTFSDLREQAYELCDTRTRTHVDEIIEFLNVALATCKQSRWDAPQREQGAAMSPTGPHLQRFHRPRCGGW